MKKITKKANVDLNVKVGGCEAKNDIYFCENLNVSGLVAPMVESAYALRKFLQTVSKKKSINYFINLESIQAFKNINKIFRERNAKFLKGVVIGRSDLAGSLNLEKKSVDSLRIYKLVLNLLKKLKNKNLLIKMGGSLTSNSKKFVSKLYNFGLLHRVETRNIEIKLNNNNIKNFENIIPEIYKFELEWLRYKILLSKKRKFKLKNDNYERIKILKKRFNF